MAAPPPAPAPAAATTKGRPPWLPFAAIAAVVAVVAGVFVIVGGGDDDDGPSTSGTTVTTVADQDVAADRAAAEAAVLQFADLPDGWSGTPHSTDTSGPDIQVEIAECVGVDPELVSSEENPTSVDSADFADDSTGATVQNSVAFTPTEDRAEKVMAVFADPAMPGCLATAMQHVLAYPAASQNAEERTDESYGAVVVEPLPFPNVGDETVAFQMLVPFSSGGQETDLYFDFIVFRIGRAGVSLSSFQPGQPFDPDLEQQLAGVVASRLGATGVEAPTTTEAASGTTTTLVEDPTSTIGGTDAGYTTVTDETGLLQVDVPVSWSDVTGSSGSDGPAIQASPDLEAFYNGYTTPGVWYFATTLYGPSDQNLILDAWVQDGCTLQESRQAYDDNLYSGIYDSYTSCGGTDASVVNIAASPADGSYLVFVHVKMIDAADQEALNQIVATFVVSSDITNG